MKKNKVFAIAELNVDQEQRINSILLIWAIATTCLSMIFAGCLVWLFFASRDVDIRVLTVEKSSKQLVEVKKLRDRLKVGDALLRAFAERVVTLKYTVDHQAEAARTAELGRYLNQEECDKLNKDFDPEDAHSYYSTMQKNDIYRQVKIENVVVLNKTVISENNIIRVEWTAIDRYGEQGEPFQQTGWVAHINMDVQPVNFVQEQEIREFGYHLIGFVATKIRNVEKM